MHPDYKTDKINFFNCDCIEYMKTIPNKYYDLAIIDPPYGLGMDGNKNWSGSKHKVKQWDSEAPNKKYFEQIFRVSKNKIIWGANHFISRMPKDSSCWIIWDKKNDGFSFADGEMAWTSFNTAVRFFRYHRGQQTDTRIHPTQKPIMLYRWLLQNYSKQGDKILDTHGGSMTIARACDMEGFELDICEIDKEYFDTGVKEFIKYKNQLTLF